MATPQSIPDPDDKLYAKEEQITFRFCSECSNMLYPKEDEDAHKLQYTCRTCQYTEEATTSCIFRNLLNTSAGETAGVTQDVGSDPTLPHGTRDPCPIPDCRSTEAVFFQSQQRSDDTGMNLFYVCCGCGRISQ